jgi:hypothetical protein
MLQMEYLPLVLTGLSITASIIYYASVLRNQNRTRQAQLFMQIFSVFASEEYMKRGTLVVSTDFEDVNDFWENQFTTQHWVHWMWLNGLGILLKKGLLDVEMVYDMTGGFGPQRIWEKYRRVFEWHREGRQNPDMFSSLGYLADEMEKFRKAKGVPDRWSEESNKFVISNR